MSDIFEKLRKRGYDAGRKRAEGEAVNFSFSLPDILATDGHSTISKLDTYCEGIVRGTLAAFTQELEVSPTADCRNCKNSLCPDRTMQMCVTAQYGVCTEQVDIVFAGIPAYRLEDSDDNDIFGGLGDDL